MENIPIRRIRDVILLSLTALLLLAAQSSFWLNHTIFDKQAFTSIVTPIVNSNETRSAIANTVVDKAFADKPLVHRLIGNNVSSLVTGLLGTDVAAQMTSSLIDKSYDYLTTSNRQVVALDLVAIKIPLQRITELLNNSGRDISIDPSNLPDKIVFLKPNDVPDIYKYSVFLLWFGPICWIGVIALIAIYLYIDRSLLDRRVYTLGAVVIIISLLGMLVGPLLPPPISAQVPLPELRGPVNEIISGLLAPFVRQMAFTTVLASLALLIFRFRLTLVHNAQSLTQKAANSISSPRETSKKSSKNRK